MTNYVTPICTVDLFGCYQCSNGGLSSRHQTAYLYPAGTLPSEIDPAKLDQAVEIKVRNIGGLVLHLQPINEPVNAAKLIGPMMGGYYGATSDSRFSAEAERLSGQRFYGAMALHDRWETQAQYDALSR
jgi:hypothetical protein